jgi:uncharacterized protein (DUF2062 family)
MPFERYLPDQEKLRGNRWLAWLGPALHHPRLWRMSRHGLALGMALGVFFGLLIPIAQIPFSAAAAVVLRANVPAAVASTLVTNPVTFGPVYYAAWRLGNALLGDRAPQGEAPLPPDVPAVAAAAVEDGWWTTFVESLGNVGKPLMLGLAVLACVFGVTTYFVVSWLFVLGSWWRTRSR